MTRDLNPDLGAYRTSVDSLLQSRGGLQLTRDALTRDGFDRDLWGAVASNLGVQGLLVPEELGGAGAEIGAAVVAVEELDGNLAPGPYLACLSASAALAAAQPSWVDDTLRAIATGDSVTTYAIACDSSGAATLSLNTQADGSARGSGELAVVPYAGTSDSAVFFHEHAGSVALCLVDLKDPSVSIDALDVFDITRPSGRVRLTDSPVRTIAVGAGAADRATDLIALLTSAEQVGLMAQVVERTVEYCRARFAFGRSVASFQGLKHQLAQMHCSFEQAVAVLGDAQVAMARDATSRRTSLLTSRCLLGPMAVRIATEGLRLRGGIGYTWEDDSHLFFRRARADEHLLGDPYRARAELARVLAIV